MDHATPNAEFLTRWLTGELTEPELAAWEKNPAFPEIKRIVETTAQLAPPHSLSRAEAWQKLQAKLAELQETPVRSIRITRRTWVWSAVAAGLALLLGIYFFQPRPETQIVSLQAESGEQIHTNLPDGSEVILNAASSLHYDAHNWEKDRKVHLAGEAFFNVTSGDPFSVVTTRGEVHVLGTRFNVKNRAAWEVQCYEGKVQVINSQSEQILTAGQSAFLEGDGYLTKSVLDYESMPAWTEGKFVFRKAPFSQVIAELERQFNVDIRAETDTHRSYTGFFYLGDLEEALTLICEPMGLQHQREKGKRIRLFPSQK